MPRHGPDVRDNETASSVKDVCKQITRHGFRIHLNSNENLVRKGIMSDSERAYGLTGYPILKVINQKVLLSSFD